MVSLVVFDLDGTLIDSRLDLANSTNEMLQSYGAAPLPVDEVTPDFDPEAIWRAWLTLRAWVQWKRLGPLYAEYGSPTFG